ncbi:MAG: DnaA N-terminal domain-containing protein [Sporolactobacillus sp.]
MRTITLSGSTAFKTQFERVHAALTLQGNLVISPPCFKRSACLAWTDEQVKLLSKLQFKRIDLSDELFVIDVDGCIGEDTRKEIAYAEQSGKTVRYYSRNSENFCEQQQPAWWNQVLELIAKTIRPVQYRTWFEGITATHEGDVFIVHCLDEFSKEWLHDHYVDVIRLAIKQVTGTHQVKIDFGVVHPAATLTGSRVEFSGEAL